MLVALLMELDCLADSIEVVMSQRRKQSIEVQLSGRHRVLEQIASRPWSNIVNAMTMVAHRQGKESGSRGHVEQQENSQKKYSSSCTL